MPPPVVASSPSGGHWRRRAPLPPPRFYLHGSGALDFRSEIATFTAATAGRAEVDLPHYWQYSVDAFAVGHLYTHQWRTRSLADADLHVLALAPSASLFAHNATDAKGEPIGNVQRMEAVMRALTSHPTTSTVWNNHSAPIVIFAPGECLLEYLGRGLCNMLKERPNVRLATADPAFGNVGPNVPFAALYRRGVTLPYLVRASFSRYASAACAASSGSVDRDRHSVVFHGDTGRYDGGMRGAVRDILHYVNGSDLVSSFRMRFNSTALRPLFARTEQAMLNGALCFAPSGDTPTSRRLFEALASGCVPIIARQRHLWGPHLPFAALIDWNAIAYFLSPARTSLAHRHRAPSLNDTVWENRRAEAAWVEAQLYEAPSQLHRARSTALHAFCSHMDPRANPSGFLDAVLTSAQHTA